MIQSLIFFLFFFQASTRQGFIKVKYDKTKERILMIGSAVTVTDLSMMIKRSKL